MKKERERTSRSDRAKEDQERLKYHPPLVVVHSEEALLDRLKTAKACSGFGGSVLGCG